MTENDKNITQNTTTAVAETQASSAASASPAAADSAQQQQFEHTKIKARYNQYTSGWFALAIPAIMTRYVPRFGFDLLRASAKTEKWKKNLTLSYSAVVGLAMGAITLFYASSTYGDLKRVFAETLAWEFDKKPQDVTVRDFWKSKNDIVRNTCRTFIKRNLIRIGLSLSNFVDFLPIKKRIDPDSHASSVDLAVGLTGTYLATDVFFRKETFFESLQTFIDRKINHSDRVGDLIVASDLMSLYDRNAKEKDPKYKVSSRMDTPKWKNDQILFGRMADLMNQTYGNSTPKEKADFPVTKLIYLLGAGLIKPDNMDESLTYIEVANRYGMGAVKQLVRARNDGVDLQKATQHFPVTIPTTIQQNEIVAENSSQDTKFTDKVASENRLNIRQAPPASHVEKTAGNGMSAAVVGP